MSRKILVAIELDDKSANDVLKKATSVASKNDVLEVLHVLHPNTVHYSPDPTMTGKMYENTFQVAMENTGRRLRSLCMQHGISAGNCHVRYGRIAYEVHQLLEEEGFDTLMIGSHGWSGWHRLLGSQANSILHGIAVDTWVFKINEEKTDNAND